MATNFPDSPSVNDTFTSGGVNYTWDGTVWTAAGSGPLVATVTTDDAAPASPADGDLWYRTSDGRTYVYYDDGNTAQWVDANPNLPPDPDTFDRSGTDVTLVNIGDNVGIGTSSPAVELDVAGEIRASSGILFGTDTAATNALDDYEEGSWTPELVGAATAGTFTYSSRGGSYTKIGRQVTVSCFLSGITIGTASAGSLLVTGLPFAAKSGGGTNAIGSLEYQSVDLNVGTRSVTSLILNGGSEIYVRETRDDLIVQNTTAVQLNSGTSNIIVTITYFTD